MIKYLLIFFSAILYGSILSAQAPQKISYQAVIRNSSNTLVVNTTVGMRITILKNSASGTVVYKERQTPTTNANGLASIQIGGGNVLSGIFANINWASGTYFIKSETDPAGGTAYSITSTTQLLSVPYALYAEKSGSASSLTGHYIGELFGGGIIYYLYKDTLGVEHGLVASLTNLNNPYNPSIDWSNIDQTLIGASAQSLHDGLANSNAIMAQSGHTSSWALACHNYNAGGFSDWYLPSFYELSILLEQKFILFKNNPSFILPSGKYYSSSEYDDDQARIITVTDLLDLNSGQDGKGSNHLYPIGVFAVRKF